MGIAASYVRDSGISGDPAVIYSQNFESSVATWSADFNGGASGGISNSTDVPTASGGTHSARLIPDGINGTLYRDLPSQYNELYLRVYMKFLGNVSHHSGMFLGGYETQNGFPQGDAGIKDGDRFISSVEQYGTPDGIDPQTRMDFYNNYVGMHGAGFGGLFFGEQFLETENVSLSINAWRCFELRVKVNTTAVNTNGEQQLWVDGVEIQNAIPGSPVGAFNGTSGAWVTGAGSAFPGFQWRDRLTYAINWIKIQNYSDVGTPYDVLFDDLVVATSYIGPLNTGAVSGSTLALFRK